MKSAQDLHAISQELRADVLRMVYAAGAGHVAGPLSAADLFTLLYFGGITKFDHNHPEWQERDRVVLSAGHYCPILYASLARAGFFPVNELSHFGSLGSELGIHPEKRMGDNSLPGVEVSSGPLGQGVSVAVGIALALKIEYGERAQADTPKVFCVVSDGELEEGQVWEAFQFAVRRQLDNLIFLLDRNGIQIEHFVSEVTTYGEITARLEAFGLNVSETDGNDLIQTQKVLTRSKTTQGAPAMVVLNTTAGKGVGFMQGNPVWHDKVPTKTELARALKELSL